MSDSTTNTPVTPSTTANPEDVVTQLRAIRQLIPEYGQIPATVKTTLHSAANVSPHFVNASINTIGASTVVQAAVGRSPEELLQESSDVARWSAVEDELRAMLNGVTAANLGRRHRLGLTALQTYGVTRQLTRKSEHADLLPHLDNMQRLNRFGRKKATSDPTPSSTPIPIPTQTPQTPQK
ncbi:MAG TPA: hypothetical protein VGJ81_04970 [Thermoanaerobaculia bacterium]|jgi:hypothetical protein